MIELVDKAYTVLVMDEIGMVIEKFRPKTPPQQVAMAVVLADLCGAALGAILAMGQHLCERDNDVPPDEKVSMMDEVQRELMRLAAQRIAKAAGFAVDICGQEIDRQLAERERRQA